MEKYSWQFMTKAVEPILARIAWDTPEDVPPGFVQRPEKRSLYLIECNYTGYGTAVIDGKEFKVSPGKCYVVHPGSVLTLKADANEPRRALWCIFGGTRAGEILYNAGITSDSPFAPDDRFEELFSILKRLYDIRLQNDMGSEVIKTAYLYEFLGVLARGKADVGRNLLAERAVGIMETEYHSDITVSDVAAELGFDRSYFSTVFKEYTGVSPYAYLTTIRIKRASDLLTGGNQSVSEIAEAVGIDPHNFSRIFKREMGISPLDYRRKIPKADKPT